MWGRREGEDREMYLFIKRNIFTPIGHPLPHFPTFCTFNAEQTSDITFSHPPPLGKAWNRRPRSGYSLSADYETWLLNGDRGGRKKLEAASLEEIAIDGWLRRKTNRGNHFRSLIYNCRPPCRGFIPGRDIFQFNSSTVMTYIRYCTKVEGWRKRRDCERVYLGENRHLSEGGGRIKNNMFLWGWKTGCAQNLEEIELRLWKIDLILWNVRQGEERRLPPRGRFLLIFRSGNKGSISNCSRFRK